MVVALFEGDQVCVEPVLRAVLDGALAKDRLEPHLRENSRPAASFTSCCSPAARKTSIVR